MKSFAAFIVLGVLLAYCGSSEAQETTTENTPSPTPSSWYECPAPDGNFYHPYDCAKYFVCVSNNAWLFRCPANLLYDDVKEICDFPGNVNCRAQPT